MFNVHFFALITALLAVLFIPCDTAEASPLVDRRQPWKRDNDAGGLGALLGSGNTNGGGLGALLGGGTANAGGNTGDAAMGVGGLGALLGDGQASQSQGQTSNTGSTASTTGGKGSTSGAGTIGGSTASGTSTSGAATSGRPGSTLGGTNISSTTSAGLRGTSTGSVAPAASGLNSTGSTTAAANSSIQDAIDSYVKDVGIVNMFIDQGMTSDQATTLAQNAANAEDNEVTQLKVLCPSASAKGAGAGMSEACSFLLQGTPPIVTMLQAVANQGPDQNVREKMQMRNTMGQINQVRCPMVLPRIQKVLDGAAKVNDVQTNTVPRPAACANVN